MPAPLPEAAQPPAEKPTTDADAATAAAVAPGAEEATTKHKKKTSEGPAITEAELRQMLVGKPLFLRGGFLDNSLLFNEHGGLIGHSAQGSYTLAAIQIDKLRLLKHKVEIEGTRYGLHFLGQLAFEDPSSSFDRVRITPKKKIVRITIDREIVVSPKKIKEIKKERREVKPALPVTVPVAAAPAPSEAVRAATVSAAPAAPAAPVAEASVPAAPVPAASESAAPAASTPAPDAPAAVAPTANASGPAPAAPATPAAPAEELTPAEQLKASIAATPVAEQPADPNSVTTTTSPAHATAMLKDAVDKIFAQGLDERMMAGLPDFWKLYYEAVAAKADYRPKDSSVLRQGAVDKKAVLLSKFEPASNEYAQANGVAGMALYHTVIGVDGKAREIAVARPIGFGLDENAVESIRAASFEPALKDGKPVPVLLDLVVQFRIFSNRTAVNAAPESTEKPPENQPAKPAEPKLPGPYSVGKPATGDAGSNP